MLARRWRFVLVGLCCVLALAGCSPSIQEPKAGTMTTAPSGPATVTTPTQPSTAPPMPDTARQGSAAGAESFVRYYFEALNYAYGTGDVTPVNAISVLESCKVCRSISESIAQQRANGEVLHGGRVEIESVKSGSS